MPWIEFTFFKWIALGVFLLSVVALILFRRGTPLLKQTGPIPNALGEHTIMYPIPYQTAPNLTIGRLGRYTVEAQDEFGFRVKLSSSGSGYDPVWDAKGLRQGRSPGKARSIGERAIIVIGVISGIATIATTFRDFMTPD